MAYEYDKVATPESGLRLHLNENTAGCSPKVLTALHAMTREQAAYYPDYGEALASTASFLRVRPEEVLLTNGLDEGILAAAVWARRSQVEIPEAIVVVPAFDMYAVSVDSTGGRVVQVNMPGDFSFPLEAVRRAITSNTRLIFMTSPNNPTGQVIPREQILEVARAAPHALIFLDEAYADFSGETLLGDAEARKLPHLIIGRTFAKAHGLAGLRAGAIVGHADTLAPLRQVVPPFSLNACAALALAAGLNDREYYEWYLGQVRTSKILLYEALDRLGVRYWASAANFVLIDFGADAQRIIGALADRQLYVRDRSRDAISPGCVRVTTGVVEHTHTLVRALEEVL